MSKTDLHEWQNTIETEDAQTAKLKILKKQKRGLMQQLLTGKLREGGGMSDIKLFTLTGQSVIEITGAAMALENRFKPCLRAIWMP